MRRAFQRCHAHLPRVASTFKNSGLSKQLALQSDWLLDLKDIKQAPLPVGTARSLHTSTFLRQQASSTQQVDDADLQNLSHDAPITKFQELETRNIIHRNVVQTLTQDMGLHTMTEVQSATINQALKGNDVIAQARTGTGKTLAFLLPVLQNIISVDPELARRVNSRRGPRTTADDIRALIISPTRELAEQIAVEANRLVRNTGVIVQTAVGGTQKRIGLRNIQQQGCHILVGTPGRLKDILTDPYSRVEAPDLSALVFDEADRLLDQGFWPEIQEIMRLLPTPAEKNRQTMMFSATVPREVVSLVRTTLKPGFDFVKCVRDDEEPTHTRVKQRIVTATGFENSLPTLVELCTKSINAGREPGGKPFKAIVYFNSTAEVTLAASALRNLHKPGETKQDAFGAMRAEHPWGRQTKILDIHSKLAQGQRTKAADYFRNAESAVLLSSDVTARGMDFPNVTHVIQMGIPSSREQYIHRIGRTARAGKEGEGWLIVNTLEEQEAQYRLAKLPLQRDSSLESATVDVLAAVNDPQTPAAMTRAAFQHVTRAEMAKSYVALLGVFGWIGRRKQELVYAMNDLATKLWGMDVPPSVSPMLAQKLGLSRLRGLILGHEAYKDEEMDARGGFGGGRGGFGGRDDRSGGRMNTGGGYGGRRDTGFDRQRDDAFSGRRDGGFGGRRDDRSNGYGGGGNRFNDRSNDRRRFQSGRDVLE